MILKHCRACHGEGGKVEITHKGGMEIHVWVPCRRCAYYSNAIEGRRLKQRLVKIVPYNLH